MRKITFDTYCEVEDAWNDWQMEKIKRALELEQDTKLKSVSEIEKRADLIFKTLILEDRIIRHFLYKAFEGSKLPGFIYKNKTI